MIARLQRFYGGNPREWLRLPLALIRSYSENIGMLQAEESLLGVQVAMASGGNMKPNAANAIIRRWGRAAGSSASATIKPTSEEERMAMAERIGIKT